MTNDPLIPARSGGISPLVTSARAVNAVLEAARAHHRGDRRRPGHRAFGDPTDTSGGTSGDCSGIVGILRAGSCMTMSIIEVLGACDCIDASQTASLTYDSDEAALTSEDLLYGCPPGVLTTICADDGLNTGAPDKWNIVVAGFGAPNTNLNQSYTLTHTTGEVWVGVKNGVTVTATRGISGWTLSIDDGTVTVTYDTAMAFCCATITFDIDDDDGTTTAPATLDMTVATACGNGPAYTARLEKVASDCGLCLKFTWVPVAGSGSRTIPFAQVGCGTDGDGSPYIEFATDDPLICTGDTEACGENRVVVRLTCGCADIPPISFESCPLIGATVCLTMEDLSGNHPELNATFELDYAGLIDGQPSYLNDDVTGCCPIGLVAPGSYAYTTQVYCAEDPDNPGSFNVNLTYGPDPDPDDFCWMTGDNVSVVVRLTQISSTTYTALVRMSVATGPAAIVRFTVVDGGACTPADHDCGDLSSFTCIPGTGCVEVFDGSGAYASYTECNVACSGGGGGGGDSADCTACGLAGDTPTLVIPDGPNAGTHPADGPWEDDDLFIRAAFVITGGVIYVYCLKTAMGINGVIGSAGDVIMTASGGITASGVSETWLGSTDCGPPSVMTFDGTNLDATGDCTVTT